MEVLRCDSCKGYGEIRVTDDRNEYEMIVCSECNGTGRILTRSYTYKVPFDFDVNRLYKVDAKIIDLIRSLK